MDKDAKELRRANKRLIELDKTKNEFVSIASHQLRTPLTSIKGYISMLLEGDAGELNPTQIKFLEEAYNSSERMVRLISDFLNLSRLETGKFVIDKSAVDLAKIVAEEATSIRPLAKVNRISINYKKPSMLPYVMIDENKIRQVIMNYIDNAIYYSKPKSMIILSLKQKGDYLEFKVKDQGIGVPKSVQHKLFSKFFRADNARVHRPDGTGVGLFLAKKIIDGHGGEILFNSAENRGSTFGFKLPIK